MLNLYISEETGAAIQQAAEEAQAHFETEKNRHYRLDDLKRVYVTWLEQSVEQLALDAGYHSITGPDTYSFNRQGFERALEKLDYAEHPADGDVLEAA